MDTENSVQSGAPHLRVRSNNAGFGGVHAGKSSVLKTPKASERSDIYSTSKNKSILSTATPGTTRRALGDITNGTNAPASNVLSTTKKDPSMRQQLKELKSNPIQIQFTPKSKILPQQKAYEPSIPLNEDGSVQDIEYMPSSAVLSSHTPVYNPPRIHLDIGNEIDQETKYNDQQKVELFDINAEYNAVFRQFPSEHSDSDEEHHDLPKAKNSLKPKTIQFVSKNNRSCVTSDVFIL
uniref:Uncharacterized protein n=1 Tax=Timspurckia oligopyrenoides TaxID=708627 RepID=A0A7S0ZE96_9RHOD|mmetsp:Transcript_1925/g.3421  ORF Transcript_1925/g.3421 Transcript_1925/m.3421 type:complete len:237 (+) Transcript_1925:49-759(+)